MAYNVYSFPDVKAVLNHADVGQCNLHQSGMGKITVSSSGDLASHTTTADGYVIVNRLKTTNGTITIEVPQGSVADWLPTGRSRLKCPRALSRTGSCGSGPAGPGPCRTRTASPSVS